MTLGLLVMAGAFAGFTRLGLETPLAEILLWCFLSGIAVGMAMIPTTATALAVAPAEKAGMASGVVSTFRQLGGTLGLALMAALVATRAAGTSLDQPAGRAAFVGGIALAYGVTALVALAGAAVAFLSIRGGRPAISAAISAQRAAG